MVNIRRGNQSDPMATLSSRGDGKYCCLAIVVMKWERRKWRMKCRKWGKLLL